MHRKSIDWVVHFGKSHQAGSGSVDQSCAQANDKGTATLHIRAGSRDGDQPSKNTVAHAAHLIPPGLHESYDQGSHASRCRRNGRVHCNLRSQMTLRCSMQLHSGAAIEPVPAKPEEESAKDHQWQAVGVEFVWSLPPAMAGTRNGCAHQRRHPTGHVHHTASREVHVAGLGDSCQKTVPPGPGHDHRIDEGSHEDGVQHIGRELHTFRHTSTHNGGSNRAKCPLEVPICGTAPNGEHPLVISFQEPAAKKHGSAYETSV
mmetsp:Transcript_10701/g.25162  ORF Transcript_10701/g.25162 Transcript_10701/m.25162 type:complete len:260 (-) Transcript_10701:501-1280(-)